MATAGPHRPPPRQPRVERAGPPSSTCCTARRRPRAPCPTATSSSPPAPPTACCPCRAGRCPASTRSAARRWRSSSRAAPSARAWCSWAPGRCCTWWRTSTRRPAWRWRRCSTPRASPISSPPCRRCCGSPPCSRRACTTSAGCARTAWRCTAACGCCACTATSASRIGVGVARRQRAHARLRRRRLRLRAALETQLADLLGCRFAFAPLHRAHLPVRDAAGRSSVPGVYLAGDGAGIMGADAAEWAGERAALALLADHGVAVDTQRAARTRTQARQARRVPRRASNAPSPCRRTGPRTRPTTSWSAAARTSRPARCAQLSPPAAPTR